DARGKLIATAATTARGANLEDALALAAAMLPPGAPGRIVVASDGNETGGDAARALPAMLERGVRVDVVPTGVLTTGEVLVEQVSDPERVYAGDTFLLQAVIYSHGPSPATVRILKDGETIAERSLELPAGRSRIDTDIPNATAGRVRYEVAVEAPGDAFPQNN